jgi:hypothetical protein
MIRSVKGCPRKIRSAACTVTKITVGVRSCASRSRGEGMAPELNGFVQDLPIRESGEPRIFSAPLVSSGPSSAMPIATKDAARRATIVAATLTLLAACPEPARAQHPVPIASGIWQSGNPSYALSAAARHRLFASLARITGIEGFAFATDGRLEMGTVTPGHRGSSLARRILQDSLASGNIFVLEDHSNSAAVNFGQIEGMQYINDATSRHDRVWWIRLDFADFLRIDAPPRVRATFDEGFTFLHELLHALGHHDTTNAGELGECETILNQAREEVGLPLRAEYFATLVRSPAFGVAAVRLRFLDRPIGQTDRHEQDLFFALSMLAPSTSTASVHRRPE